MATILTMNLPSDDEADSDYSFSEHSSGDEREVKKTKRQLKRELQLEKERQELKNKVDALFGDMLQESDQAYRHKQTVKSTDFLLQFHKKDHSSSGPKNKDIRELENFVSLSSSSIFEEQQTLDICEFKEQCRNTPDAEKLELIHQAVRDAEKVEPSIIAKTYKFAGKTYTVKEHVDKSSKKYKQFAKKQSMAVGGSLSFIDDMVHELDSAPKISAIKKSEADWNQYKDEHKIDTLHQDHRFLKEQDFLHRASWKEHDNYLHVRRQ
ncbi:bucentaur or craniofacial development domain-containing protein, putative [Babesia ovata]|uniref:Bucentaur or craniofacial development domain-containing protein, putative n=1 Tax=Babesia ovata TaxID=189622 RepID=A0A2H6KI96_9APIC|nr:bucentaur or craniofacial development domain-containing protein, putative [Babesia ovata]GBE62714.1 bucentaur or craniofacial development domain-containing protein, putative [Babesia ovata]